MSSARYDQIGIGYRDYRRPDPRIARQLHAALDSAGSVLNVGAGVGSYEPEDRRVVGLEPSEVMIRQRPDTAAPVVQEVVEKLPFPDSSFDAVMGVLTLHHWRDKAGGLGEVVRVARDRVVLLSWVGYVNHFWLFDYFPEIKTIDEDIFPGIDEISAATDWQVEAEVLNIPFDCTDGFMCSYWRRPAAYLDPGARRSISTFNDLERVEERLQALRDDLDSGRWQEANRELLELETMDYGYRVMVLTPGINSQRK